MIHGDINMGSGVTLRSLPRLADHLGIPGFGPEEAKTTCELLGVPCVRIADTWFVNMFELQIAFAGATKIGMKDFALPGSDQPTKSVDTEQILEKMPILVTQLMMARRGAYKEVHDSVIEAGRSLAKRLQAALSTRLLEAQRKEPYKHKAAREFNQYKRDILKIEEHIRVCDEDPPARR